MERSRELETLVEAWFAAVSRGDASLMPAHVSDSDGARLIGGDPSEVCKGGAAIRQFLAARIEAGSGQTTFRPADTEAFTAGSIGWATTFLTMTAPDGRCVTPRWSAVFEHEDGVWRLVQIHASIGVPNDEIDWVSPD